MNDRENQDLGFHAYIRGIILFGFALLLLAFILTGNIRYYIAPSMMPFVYFSTAVFLLLGVLQIIRSTSKGQEEEQLCDCGTDHSMEGSKLTKLLIYSIFIAPIVTGFVLPDKTLDSSVAANRGIQFSSKMAADALPSTSTDPNSATEVSGTSRAEAFLENPEEYYRQLEERVTADSEEEPFSPEAFYTEEGFNSFYGEMAKELLQEEKLIVTEDNYLDVMTVLELYLDQFLGREIEILGFVYRDEEFEDNHLVVARFGMTCCVADATVYGTMIEAEEAKQYENDTWIQATGIISQTEYQGFQIPLVHLQGVEIVPEPETPYVFPSFRF